MHRTVARVATGALALACTLITITGDAQAAARTVLLVSPGTSGAIAAFAAMPASSATQVVFATNESLAAADSDATTDLYLRNGSAVSLLTPATTALVTFNAVSANGTKVIFTTVSALTPADTDTASDIYSVVAGAYTLLSGGSASTATVFKAASSDASKVVFETTEALGGDSNAVNDVYLGAGGAPTLLSGGGVAATAATYAGGAADLSTVVFQTNTSLAAGDLNAVNDVYAVPGTGGAATLVSDGTGGADSFAEVTPNGQRVFWTTEDDNAGLGDVDGTRDVYATQGGTKSLVSAGAEPVSYGGSSADGSITFYATLEAIAPADGDVTQDVYRFKDSDDSQTLMTGGAPSSIHNAIFRDTSADGSVLTFETREALASTPDTGTGVDLYRSTGPVAGDKTLVSGTGAADVSWVLNGASDDGSRVLFTSTDPLTGADTDTAQDVYIFEAGGLQLVSSGTANDKPATYAGRSPDGSRLFVHTTEQLTAGDTDAASDVYESRLGVVVTPPPPDTTPPSATVTGKAEQKNNGKVKVTVTCGPTEACKLKATGSIKAGGKTFDLTGASVNAPANGKTTLKLKVPKKAKTAAAAALAGGKKVKGTVKVVVSDAAGNARTLRFKYKLK
jgi:hypothetical protein